MTQNVIVGWRLHKEFVTWFQRLKPPVHMDEFSERGHVVFFNNMFPASAHPLSSHSKHFTPEKRQAASQHEQSFADCIMQVSLTPGLSGLIPTNSLTIVRVDVNV